MSSKKGADFRQMTGEELQGAETRVREELFRLRFQQHTAQLTNTAQLRDAKRELARILTVLKEREMGISAAPKPLGEQAE